MTSVANAISALLYTHDTVIVPGLGAFLCHAEGAKVNVITSQFEKPSATLSFDPMQREENDLVVNYLVANDGITVEEARQLVMTFVSDVFAQLKAGAQAEITGVGSLSYGDNQEVVFRPVETNDFNVDAFGLDNFNPQPVYGTRRESFETEPEPNTVEPEPQDKKRRHRLWWLWLLLPLVLLLVAAAVGGAWWYLNCRPVPTKPWPKRSLISSRPVQERPHTIDLTQIDMEKITPSDTLEYAPEEIIEMTPEETIETTSEETPETTPETTSESTPEPTPEVVPAEPSTERPVEVIVPEATSKAFIVGGCFEIEKNALKMTTEAREQGCTDAFVMKRGSKFFVCYGQYPSMADAKAALPQVRSNFNTKAWILKK